jgi:hypothetical protein
MAICFTADVGPETITIDHYVKSQQLRSSSDSAHYENANTILGSLNCQLPAKLV